MKKIRSDLSKLKEMLDNQIQSENRQGDTLERLHYSETSLKDGILLVIGCQRIGFFFTFEGRLLGAGNGNSLMDTKNSVVTTLATNNLFDILKDIRTTGNWDEKTFRKLDKAVSLASSLGFSVADMEKSFNLHPHFMHKLLW